MMLFVRAVVFMFVLRFDDNEEDFKIQCGKACDIVIQNTQNVWL